MWIFYTRFRRNINVYGTFLTSIYWWFGSIRYTLSLHFFWNHNLLFLLKNNIIVVNTLYFRFTAIWGQNVNLTDFKNVLTFWHTFSIIIYCRQFQRDNIFIFNQFISCTKYLLFLINLISTNIWQIKFLILRAFTIYLF